MQIKQAVEELTNNSTSSTPVLDAQVLCSVLIDCDKTYLYAHPEQTLTESQEKQLKEYKKALLEGIPLPYILGEWEFFGETFYVSPDTLIPRPETEELVEHAMIWLKNNPKANTAIDVGTGSGCIALTLAKQFPRLKMHAVDVSVEALEIAKKNAVLHNVVEQLEFRQQDLLSNNTNTYDLICANLPYIPTETLRELEVAEHEPWLALDGGDSGLDLIEKLLIQAKDHLSSNFMMIFEFEYRHGKSAQNLAVQYYPDAHISILKDLSNNDRFLVITSN